MRVPRTSKFPSRPSRMVAVVASPADLARALRLRRRPDFFELRLDAPSLSGHLLEKAIPRLEAPLLLTARTPREGGFSQMNGHARAAALGTFLPHAAAVDIELRSVPAMHAVLDAATASGLERILSVHTFHRCPSRREMEQWLAQARTLGVDIFKLAVRTETLAELNRLLSFFDKHHEGLPLAVMGIGQHGRASRLALARRGSALHYAHLGHEKIAGQLSLAELRRALAPSR